MNKLTISFISLILFLLFSIPVFAYSDVSENFNYHEAINFITDQGIVNGYDDGTYRPSNQINRAEFTKILIEAKINRNPLEFTTKCFDDLDEEAWYLSYICYAKNNGFINGYPDGTFQPSNPINLVEAATILVNVFDITTEDPAGTEWYSVFIEALGRNNYIPPSLNYLGQTTSRGEVAEMIWRIMENKNTLESTAVNELKQGACQPLGEDLPGNININQIRDAWLEWTNTARQAQGLHPYTYNRQLDRTAINWSEISENRGYIDHKRPGTSAYYDYWAITSWFSNLGLKFDNVYGVTHTENIGWGPYNCNDADCSQQLINSIRTTFDFFMSEKNQAYRPHYNSIMNTTFNEIGLGIAIDPLKKKYYLTVHYGTRIISDPLPVCN